jgi:hypothetical protein
VPCQDLAVALRHALLALLEAKPMTGYELAGQFDADLKATYFEFASFDTVR